MTMNRLSEYGHGFQLKVIGLLLTDKDFLQAIFDLLSLEYFESEAHKWIIEYILKYYHKYNIYPTMEVLSIEVKKVKKDPLRLSVVENLRQAYNYNADDASYVKEEFSNFCQNQAMKQAIMQSVDLLNDGNFSDIRRIMDAAMRAGQPKDAGHDYRKDVETRFREEENAKTITFPWKIFNTNTDGGLGGGDLMLLFAPPGVGKTTVALNIAAHNIKHGKKVVFYSLELKANYIGKKIDSILTGIPVKDIRKHRTEVDTMMEAIPGDIYIKAYNPGKASLDTIEAHLNYLKNAMEFIPDLVIIDYPELLKVRKARREQREEVDDVYTDIKGVAMERNIPIICPSQINRLGAKDDIIEGDKTAGSYGKQMIADLNISLSRKRKDKLRGTGRFHWIKSRLGPDGMTYGARIDLTKGYIEVDEDEYDDSQEDTSETREINGHKIEKEETKTLRSLFKRFETAGNP